VITGVLGDDDMDSGGKITTTLDIPIIVDNEKRGYVRLHLLLDDIKALVREAMVRRLVVTVLIFLAGMAGVVVLSFGLTRSLNDLASAAGRVAEGDLQVNVPKRGEDEVGGLVTTFNQMVQRLREQRALESRLRRAERASAVGKLASAVAHEIRNPLNLISLSVDHLGEAYPPHAPQQAAEFARLIASVQDELRRLDRMVRDFLSYGRPPRLALRSCRAEEIVDEVLSLTAVKAKEQRIDIEKQFSPDLPAVQADVDGLRTCFMNVAMNAIQAMPTGGRLVVGARTGRLPSGAVSVVLTFADNGSGISAADLDRIFEPYFSTREAGVGLGLAITQRIVQDHGGEIQVSSAPGAGTTFRIEIPTQGAGAIAGDAAAGASASEDAA
jgi:hypothetical protein